VPIRFGRLTAAHALLLFLPMAAIAQPPETLQFKIELKSDEASIAPDYVCELEDFRTHQRVGVADLNSDDTFTFRHVPYGEYQMTISDPRGDAVFQDLVTVDAHNSLLTVQLAKRKVERPPSGPVSVAQLQHPPARKAFSALVTAQRFSESGDYRRAAEELEKAVRISPDYAEAYTNLAVQHMRLGEYERAVEEMRRANEIAKPGPVQLCNLAYAQMQLKRYDQAIESARASLRLDGNYAQAHYVLGALLARDPKTLGEALPHLERAAEVMPSAKAMWEMARKDWGKLKSQ